MQEEADWIEDTALGERGGLISPLKAVNRLSEGICPYIIRVPMEEWDIESLLLCLAFQYKPNTFRLPFTDSSRLSFIVTDWNLYYESSLLET